MGAAGAAADSVLEPVGGVHAPDGDRCDVLHSVAEREAAGGPLLRRRHLHRRRRVGGGAGHRERRRARASARQHLRVQGHEKGEIVAGHDDQLAPIAELARHHSVNENGQPELGERDLAARVAGDADAQGRAREEQQDQRLVEPPRRQVRRQPQPAQQLRQIAGRAQQQRQRHHQDEHDARAVRPQEHQNQSNASRRGRTTNRSVNSTNLCVCK